MSVAVNLCDVTKKFLKPGHSRREWVARLSAKSSARFEPTPGFETVMALDRVSLQIEEGKIFGLAGRGGAGKSTLIRLLAALLQPDDGDIRIFGYHTVRQPLQVQRLTNRIAMDASFFKGLSALENLRQIMRSNGRNDRRLDRFAADLLTRLGVDHRSMDLPLGEASPVVVQLVSVARALLSNPRLLLLDEPARALPAASKSAIKTILRELSSKQGTTVLWASKDAGELEDFCDQVALLENGQIHLNPHFSGSLQGDQELELLFQDTVTLEPCQ